MKRGLWLIALLLLPNVAASADAAREACEKGKSRLEKRHYDAAVAAFTEAIRLDPKNAEAYESRGEAYESKDEHDKAIADYNEAIRLVPKDAGAYCGRGIVYRYKHENDKAIADYTEAVRLNPKYAKAFCRRGWTLDSKGERDKAIADYNEAIRLSPKPQDADAYFCRGWAYEGKGEHDKAIADWTEAIRLDPKDAKLYCNRGWVYDQKGEYDKAVADYTEAIRRNPKDIALYRVRGSLHEKKGDKSRANEDFERFRRLGLKALLGKLHLSPARQQPKAAVEALEKRIKEQVKRMEYGDEVGRDLVALVRKWNLMALWQKLVVARTNHGRGKLSTPEVGRVEQEVAETIARLIETVIVPIDPDKSGHELTDVVCDKRGCCQGDALLFFVLGNAVGLSVRGLDVTLMAGGPTAGADSHAACLVQLADGSVIIVDATRNLGKGELASKAFQFDDAYRRCGSYWEVKDKSNPLSLHQVVRPMDISGLVAELHSVRGSVCFAKGDTDTAIARETEAIRLDPKCALAYANRGSYYVRKGDLDKAMVDYNDAIRLNPKYAAAYCLRGNNYVRKGDFGKAFPDYAEAIKLNPKFTNAYYNRGNAYFDCIHYFR